MGSRTGAENPAGVAKNPGGGVGSGKNTGFGQEKATEANRGLFAQFLRTAFFRLVNTPTTKHLLMISRHGGPSRPFARGRLHSNHRHSSHGALKAAKNTDLAGGGGAQKTRIKTRIEMGSPPGIPKNRLGWWRH